MTARTSPLLIHANESLLEARLKHVAAGGEALIAERLAELDREWSTGRTAKVGYGVMILSGVALGAATSPLWFALPAIGGLSLIQHTFSRTSWLASACRGLGFRPGPEIDHEKVALKALRGDFRHLPALHEIEDKDDIARLEGEGGVVMSSEQEKHDVKEVVREIIEAAHV
jgi:hypothetical protein